MKKLILTTFVILMAVLWGAEQAQAITGTAHTDPASIGYSQADFIISIDSASADTLADKTILFIGTSPTLASMTRLDSLGAGTTYPDTIAVAVGGLEDGTTYYWYISVEDTSETVYFPFDYRTAPKSFTTTNFIQGNNVLYTGYSTAGIESDSLGFYVAPLDSIVFNYGKVSGTYTIADTITSVTHPDTFALTGLDEGVTYYGTTIAYLADSSVVDTSTEISFTTTDLTYAVSVILIRNDSLWIKADSSGDGLAVDSLQLHSGAGTILAESLSITTVTKPDTFIIAGIKDGEVHSWSVWAFLTDSSVVETTTTATYTRPHNSFMEGNIFEWSRNFIKHLSWPFDNTSDDFTTGPIPITSDWTRIHVRIDGTDDVSTGDSIQVFLWSYVFGDSVVIDTIVAMEDDTITITPLKYRMTPNTDYSDTSLVLHPPFDWGTHYGVSATMIDTTVNEGLAQGVRTVFVVIEEIPLMSTH